MIKYANYLIKSGSRTFWPIFTIIILAALSFLNCESAPDLIDSQEKIEKEILPSITIINNTGTTIWLVHISETTADNWGDDRLAPDQIIRNSENAAIQLDLPLSVASAYDIRVIDYSGNAYTKRNQKISDNGRILFNASDFSDGPPIIITNNTGVTIWYVYITETTSPFWGKDRLYSDETILAGESVVIRLPYNINEVNRYDIMLVEAHSRSAYVKTNVPVSSYATVRFSVNDIKAEPQ